MSILRKIKVKTDEVGYDVVIGRDLIKDVGKMCLTVCKPKKIFVLTDSNVCNLYLDKTVESLKAEGLEVYTHLIESGEQSKSLENFASILTCLAELSFSRADLLIALGGGVVGDLGGFSASAYMRGMKFIQIPTTLLAQIDSSVGGKTAVDLPQGKNLVGSFYQPHLVIADLDTLNTLGDDIMKDGLGELSKYIVMKGKMFDKAMAEKNFDRQIEMLVELCIEIKREVVELDEKEGGIRMTLNLGHTLAHAIEKLSNFQIRHGKAVAMGLHLIARACVKNGMLAQDEYEKIIKTMLSFNLEIDSPYKVGELIEEISHDKKASGDSISLVLIKKMGEISIAKMPMNEAKEFLLK